MKKFIPLLLAVFAVTLASCEKDPDMDKLDNNYLVYTNYDKKADFKTFETYYLPDSILVIGDKENAEYWKDENAQEILSAYVANMNSRGYIRVDDREEADLGLQVSYVRSTYYFTDYGRPESILSFREISSFSIFPNFDRIGSILFSCFAMTD